MEQQDRAYLKILFFSTGQNVPLHAQKQRKINYMLIWSFKRCLQFKIMFCFTKKQNRYWIWIIHFQEPSKIVFKRMRFFSNKFPCLFFVAKNMHHFKTKSLYKTDSNLKLNKIRVAWYLTQPHGLVDLHLTLWSLEINEGLSDTIITLKHFKTDEHLGKIITT